MMEESDPRHLLIQVSKTLDQLAIPYAITGGMAVLIWGRPRFTADIDIVVEFEGEKVYFVSPEDLILSKLQWHGISPSSRQLEDVESVFKISGKQLDREYLAKWAEELKVSELLFPFLKK